jgi:hypothetical protein
MQRSPLGEVSRLIPLQIVEARAHSTRMDAHKGEARTPEWRPDAQCGGMGMKTGGFPGKRERLAIAASSAPCGFK